FWLAVGAIALLFLSLRLPGLNPDSLYLDDTWVALASREASVSELMNLRPPHPVGFILILGLFQRAVSGAELPVQLLPLVAGLALIPVAATLVRRATGGAAGGVLAAALVAVNPALSTFAVRAKPY